METLATLKVSLVLPLLKKLDGGEGKNSTEGARTL